MSGYNATNRVLALAAALALMPFSNTAAAEQETAGSADSPEPRHFNNLSDDAWFNDIGVLLYDDPDRDGFFSGLSLSLDADTRFNSFEVYATIDIITPLSRNEEIVERLHTTSDFHIYGRSFTDEYRLDIDLLTNYTPDTYDLQVELVDAHSNEIMDVVDAQAFRNLRSLSLESADNQAVSDQTSLEPLEPANDNVRVVEYAGGSGPALLVLCLMIITMRARRL